MKVKVGGSCGSSCDHADDQVVTNCDDEHNGHNGAGVDNEYRSQKQ